MKKEITIDIEKVYELFSQTYWAMKEVKEADLNNKKDFWIEGIREQFCGNWNVINLLGLRDKYYEWKKMCGFEEKEE